jgi:stalled ribosome rescue protein Dom34
MSHAIVWLDNKHAKFFNFSKTESDSHNVKTNEHHSHHFTDGAGKEDEKRYFHHLSDSLKDFQEIILIGPGNGKDNFKKYLESHNKEFLKKVLATETVDHPTDNQIIAFAKKYFKEHHILI